ncbi:MAG: ribonuclease III [Chromatiales bacterium]|nr:ribonuclease III [Chromatiales bacterium]
MSPVAERLSRRIGYQFADRDLLETALTHRSASNRNNERLEFLGDAVLGAVIARVLFEKFPKAREGQMSRLRASLVKGESLARMARELNLSEALVLGAGEARSGGHGRDSILADALEAVFGAISLDGGFEAARNVILAVFQSPIEGLSLEAVSKDPKTRLQEHLQGQGLDLPSYEVIDTQGESHAQTFHVVCRLPGVAEPVTGRGTSRRRGEQDAARKALKMLTETAES